MVAVARWQNVEVATIPEFGAGKPAGETAASGPVGQVVSAGTGSAGGSAEPEPEPEGVNPSAEEWLQANTAGSQPASSAESQPDVVSTRGTFTTT